MSLEKQILLTPKGVGEEFGREIEHLLALRKQGWHAPIRRFEALSYLRQTRFVVSEDIVGAGEDGRMDQLQPATAWQEDEPV